MKVVLMKGTHNWWVGELDIPEGCVFIIFDNGGLIRNDSFIYRKTTKRGRVYREEKMNYSSLIMPTMSFNTD